MKKKSIEMHIGKNGLTKGFLEDIQRRFEECENMRINVLKSARESKADVKKYADEIVEFLGKKFTYKALGFVIAVKKWRKARV